MQTKFRRQTWGFDPNYIRVKALDDQRRPLGYVYFIRRPTPVARQRRRLAVALVTLLRWWDSLTTCMTA